MTDADRIQQLEQELDSYKQLAAHLAKQNEEMAGVVKEYLEIVGKLFPDRSIIVD
ncbi:MAG: hypothetical protein ACO3C4_01605 [Candidatus Limnocylindrus sp.]